jgi:hypothetical protein
MALAKIGPALAAGNTVVLKPSELTPLSALRLGELMAEADFPDGVVNIVPGTGAIAGAHLAAHRDVDMISFTGSTATGKEVARLALGNLKRVGLELGGKSPVLVFNDADLESAIQLEPRHFGAWMGLAMIFESIDRPAAAMRAYEKALEIHPHLEAAEQGKTRLDRIVNGSPL